MPFDTISTCFNITICNLREDLKYIEEMYGEDKNFCEYEKKIKLHQYLENINDFLILMNSLKLNYFFLS